MAHSVRGIILTKTQENVKDFIPNVGFDQIGEYSSRSRRERNDDIKRCAKERRLEEKKEAAGKTSCQARGCEWGMDCVFSSVLRDFA
ncbi:MAG: hypothetical protein KDJ50_09675 [Alphaproteobacteria bacterium]|nr:hypothetical protein [Alphaproteobacteria bacterium]